MGGFALFGSVEVNNQLDYLVIRTNSVGNKLWECTFDLGYDDNDFGIAATPDGGFLLGGYTQYQAGNSSQDTYVVKTNSVGNLLWQYTYRGVPNAGLDGSGIALVLADGNYLLDTASLSRATWRRAAAAQHPPQTQPTGPTALAARHWPH